MNDKLIGEYNKELDPNGSKYTNSSDYKDTIKIISDSAIGINKQITITRLVDILKIKDGDEILYILNKNGHFSVRKMNNDLQQNEKYISVGKVRMIHNGMVTTIPKDIMDALELTFGDNLLFCLDNNDIIIKSPILPEKCTINGVIIGLTVLSTGQIVTIPEVVRDLILVEMGDIVIFVQKNCNIIVKPIEEKNELTIVGMSRLGTRLQIYIKKELQNIIDAKDSLILWILDNNGDIIMRNTILPRTCI